MKYVALLVLLLPAVARAEAVITPFVGANAVSFQGHNYPSDFEGGGGIAASLSPHITGQAAGWYGLGEGYARGIFSAIVTATDVNDENFSKTSEIR